MSYSPLTAQNVSDGVIRPVIGSEVTISSLYTSSETGTISYTYQWYKSERLYAPDTCDYGVIPADFKLFGSTTPAISTTAVTGQMMGTYRCDVEAKNANDEIVGQAAAFFTVMPPAIALNSVNTIGLTT